MYYMTFGRKKMDKYVNSWGVTDEEKYKKN